MRNPYEVLGVPKTATAEEIKQAYRAGARKHHPDMNPGDDGAAERFKEVQSAYDQIGDPVKRAQYDSGHMNFRRRGRSSGSATPNPGPPPGFSFEEVMSEFFGGSKVKGRNITVRIEIELKDVLTGCKKYVKLKKRKPCESCRGEGVESFKTCNACAGAGFVQMFDAPFEMRHPCKSCGGTGKWDIVKCSDCAGTGLLPGFFESDLEVNIPPGIESGMQIRYNGQGEQSTKIGGQTGDAIVFILVKEHPIFSRENQNITVEVPVSYTQLVLGGEIEVPTLGEGIIKVKVPPGSQSHTKFRIKGRGLPCGHGIGDLIATVKVEIPKTPDPEYQEVLERLAAQEQRIVTPRREHWSQKVRTEAK